MNSQVTNLPAHAEDEIHLRDYWRVLVRRRTLILWMVCALPLLTIIVVLRWQDIYEGKAVIIPLSPQTTSSVTGVLGQLGGLLPLGIPRIDNPSLRLLAILQSRTLAEDVIQHLNLLPLLYADDWDANTQQWTTDEPPTMQEAVKLLLQEVVVSTWDEKKGAITITAAQPDPVLAAALVNQVIQALQRSLNENSFTLAKKNRVFIQEQLQQTKRNLELVEEALRQFEHTHGIVALDAQAQAAISALASLEAQIMAKEVQLWVLQRTLTQSSREVFLLQEELQGLRIQLARFQQGTPSPFAPSAGPGQNSQMFLSLDKAPDIKLQYARLQRESLIQSKLYALFIEQYEQAKINEVRDETAFQVLDGAIPPELKVRPKRAQMVILATVAGAFLGVFVAFFLESLDTTVRTREQIERQLGLPLLASVVSPVPPRRRQRQLTPALETVLVMQATLEGPHREAFRYLYTRLKRIDAGRNMQTLLFTTPGDEADMTATTLATLAIVAAHAGEKTLLVDSNLRSPALHVLLRCPQAPGLVEILDDLDGWQKGIQRTQVDNLHLIPTGTAILPTAISLGSSTLDLLLAHFRATYDMIFLAAPPVHSCADTAVLSSKADATFLILTWEASRLEVSLEAKATLEAVQGKVLGVILTNAPSPRL